MDERMLSKRAETAYAKRPSEPGAEGSPGGERPILISMPAFLCYKTVALSYLLSSGAAAADDRVRAVTASDV
jgi:hypothetical protein